MQRKINKKVNPIISIISCITLIASLTPAYAVEANASGGKTSSEALLTAQPATFSVTVPTALPVNVDASGAITVATDAKISNNSAGPVKVVSCQMNTLNNWAITSEPSKAKVGAKEFNFTLNDKAFDTDGNYDTSTWDTIGANNNLLLVYTSEVAPQKTSITEPMANVIFTIDWDNSPSIIPNSLAVNTPPNKTQYEEGDAFNAEGLTFILTMEDGSTKALTANDVIITGGDSITSGTPVTATYNRLSCNIPITLPNSYTISIPEGASTRLSIGETLQLTSAASYSYYRSIGRWTSSNENIATVSNTGLVTAKNAGTTIISYTNGNLNTSITIYIIGENTRVVDKYKMKRTLQYLMGDITFRDSTEVPATYDRAIDVSMDNDGSVMVYDSGQDAIIQADGGVLAPADASLMFNNYHAISMDLRGLDTSQTTDMMTMFSQSQDLTTLDLSSFDTSNVTDMGGMFNGCSALTSLDLSNFNTSNVANMEQMFNNCKALEYVNLNSFDSSKLSNMRHMFASCEKLTSLDFSSFDLNAVKLSNSDYTFSGLIQNCTSLSSIYVRNQADADILNANSSKPTNVNIIIKT